MLNFIDWDLDGTFATLCELLQHPRFYNHIRNSIQVFVFLYHQDYLSVGHSYFLPFEDYTSLQNMSRVRLLFIPDGNTSRLASLVRHMSFSKKILFRIRRKL